MNPDQVKAFLEQTRAMAPYYQAIQQKTAERGPVNVAPGNTVLGPDNKPVFTAGPAPITPYQQAELSGQAAARAETHRHNTVTEAAAPQQTSDVADAVAGMKAGTIPPQLPGRASKEYVQLLAEAKRQGYDLAGAATDWNATQKHISTMNGSQQLRLNQSINALPEMLDSVDALAAKWKAGKFPLLNRANLALAKGGALGKDAASIANQLSAQIADVTADLGNVYMGGNSPTDHALGLAAKSLSADWDEKVLHDMTDLARRNVTIRRNSIRNTGVAGASPNNPYAPPATDKPADLVYDRVTKKFTKPGGGL